MWTCDGALSFEILHDTHGTHRYRVQSLEFQLVRVPNTAIFTPHVRVTAFRALPSDLGGDDPVVSRRARTIAERTVQHPVCSVCAWLVASVCERGRERARVRACDKRIVLTGASTVIMVLMRLLICSDFVIELKNEKN